MGATTRYTVTMKQRYFESHIRYNRDYLLLVVCYIFICASSFAQDTLRLGEERVINGISTIDGYIYEKGSDNYLVGANIFIPSLNIGESTNERGRFTLKVPVGTYEAEVSYIGYATERIVLQLEGSGQLEIYLSSNSDYLDEVVISADDPRENIESSRMGVSTLSSSAIEKLPTFIGETDILKSLILLPGVSSVGEASSGVNVRGGGTDENLLLLGGSPIYNPSHLFGFFSSVNSELIENVTVFKGGVPSRYGGRASSVIDMKYKNGDFENWSGSGSIGTIASKVQFEGPLIKNKLSVLGGGRVSYINWLLQSLNDPELKNSRANFYDVNFIATYKPTERSYISGSFYNSSDDFNLLGEDIFAWQNTLASINFDHSFSSKLFLRADAGLSNYSFNIQELTLASDFIYQSGVEDLHGSVHLDYNYNEDQKISAGVSISDITISPGSIDPLSLESEIVPDELREERGRTFSLYFQHDISKGKLGLSYGLRLSDYINYGEDEVNVYDPLLPRSIENVVDQLVFTGGESQAQHTFIEPRFSLRYLLGDETSVKLGYNRMAQTINQISNTTTIAPTDIWKLSDFHVDPLISDQYSFGFFKNFGDGSYETSIETYFKSFTNIIEYKDGADLILNEHLETELLPGIGRAYGVELFIKKNSGKLTGWLSYTYSRSERRVIGLYEVETINYGEWYPSNFDKPHDVALASEYRVGDRLKFSAVFAYSRGRPVSFPVAKFNYQGRSVAYYDLRNTNRIPDYHRMDLAMTFSFGSKMSLLDGDWILSFYNLYGRKNAFSVFFDDVEGAPPQAFRLSTLGIIFPSLSYKVEF